MEPITEIIVWMQETFVLAFMIRTGFALFWLIVFMLGHRLLADRLIRLLKRITDRTHFQWDTRLLEGMRKPLKTFFLLTGIYLFLITFPLSATAGTFWLKAFRSLAVILIFGAAAGFFEVMVSDHLRSSEEIEIEDTLVPLISSGVKIVVFLLAALVVAEEWNYDIKGFIAGLGLAGFALALGAQETIKNILSGFFIISDRVFKVGDWISNGQVEGIVESLNYRTTKIRTFARSVITVPNSVLVDGPLTNWTEMNLRQMRFSVGVTYHTTPEQIKMVVSRIRKMLEDHEHVAKDPLHVYFTEFSDSSLDILVYVFTDTLHFAEFHRVREEINLSIMGILREENVSVAFPSRSVYMGNPVPTKESFGSDPVHSQAEQKSDL